ncbi:mas-related G-protein coupled receptor member X1-like isoform X1 [Sphaeramia orbicularis]|uniref:Mas-related G-protein coupled receptor member X1-like n=1 Tax=Sphaeramia orbicularis TaxID=375764 RepID=A0A672YQ18_9TELE|nr:mas-related G-protein coupled receptor member X1-like isoform X1 [Sphaeramia orbicularis]
MEDLNIPDHLENVSYSFSNITDDYDDEEDTFLHILTIVTWIIISISLPLTLMALYLTVRDKHVLIYIINLLISGVIQLCCLIAIMADLGEEVIIIPFYIYWYAEIASINFMVCVAFERYLAIARPMWYHFSRSVKIYVVVCIVVWLLPIVYLVVLVFAANPQIDDISFGIIHLLPFPFFLFFLVGAVRALSAAIHLNSVEKRRIIGTLVLPILTYSLLFIPFIIRLLGKEIRKNMTLTLVTFIFLFLSPLANVILYVFIRKGFMDKVLMSLCCKMDKNENSTLGTSLNEAAEGQLAPKD